MPAPSAPELGDDDALSAGVGAREVDRPTVFAAALLVAVGGIVYELILGTAASTLFGDSVVAYSLATGVTLFGMGIGSLLAGRLQHDPGLNFVRNEVVLALLGGCSVLVLYWAFAASAAYWVVFAVLSLAIGAAIGVEIPLLMALLRHQGSADGVTLLSRVLALDYFGALVASLLFPFVLLPHLGLVRTALAMALLNVAVAVFMLGRMRLSRRWSWTSVLALVMIAALYLSASRLEGVLSARLYQDPVVHAQTSAYQRIVVTDYRNDVRLYLDNQLQFSSLDEARYHETLAHAALTSVQAPDSVLILGGGDGLLTREVLRYDSVTEVTVVDLDRAVTDLARSDPRLRLLNEGALDDPRVTVVNADAFGWLRGSSVEFDVVLVDLVDPADERLAKLYSQEFAGMVAAHLRPGGVAITQATSTYFTPRAFWQVVDTVQAATPERTVVPLSVNVPSFGEWGFVLSLPAGETTPMARTPLPTGLRFHDGDSLRATTALSGDNPEQHPGPSTLMSPTIQRTYREDMAQWRY
ncbi:polyamine aminopropyltransferase [Cellulomonas sp. NPDC089187]|uniref:polyamine aminopropyltransferase n=1 Tax=Cellulomonas sp. NPDC089187 TaxID=3154970 RepID=UPI0034442C1B